MSTERPFDYLLKLLLIGDSGAGKTCLLFRFTDDAFNKTFISTIGIDFAIRTIELDGKQVKLQIWDTAGQERFRSITNAYYRGAYGVFVLFDMTNKPSFEHVSKVWLPNIRKHAQENVHIQIVATKCDMRDKLVVSRTETNAFTAEHQLEISFVSAKANINVEETFQNMARAVITRINDAMRIKRETAKRRAVASYRGQGSLFTGWIKKKRGKRPHIWQKNWGVLSSSDLTYSDRSKSSSPVRGTIPLCAILDIVQLAPGRFNLVTASHTYEIRTLGKQPWLEQIMAATHWVTPSQLDLYSNDTSANQLYRGAFHHVLATYLSDELHQSMKLRSASVALKCLRLESLHVDPTRVDRFVESTSLLNSICHANIVRVLGRGMLPISSYSQLQIAYESDVHELQNEYPLLPFLIMELVPLSLADFIFTPEESPLTPTEAIHICTSIAKGIEFLHEHHPPILHGKLHPSNVLIDIKFNVKVSDFSSARVCTSSDRCMTFTHYTGQPCYTAPEVLQDEPRWTCSVDVFAIGVIFFEIMHRRAAYEFEGSPISSPEQQEKYVCSYKYPPEPSKPNTTLSILDEATDNTSSLKNLISACVGPPTQRPNARSVIVAIVTATKLMKLSAFCDIPLWLAARSDERLQGTTTTHPSTEIVSPHQNTGTASATANYDAPSDNAKGAVSVDAVVKTVDLCSVRVMDEPYEFDVFVSYRVRSDRATAESIVDNLKQHNLRIFFDADEIKPTDNWQDKFVGCLRRSRIFMPLLSRDALRNSGPCNGIHNVTPTGPVDNFLSECELAVALKQLRRLLIIPVGLAEVKHIDNRDAVFFFDDFAFGDDCPDAGSPTNPTGSIRKTMSALFATQFQQLNPQDREAKQRFAKYVAESIGEFRDSLNALDSRANDSDDDDDDENDDDYNDG